MLRRSYLFESYLFESYLFERNARGPEVLAAWSTQSRTKVPRRGTLTAKQLLVSWLKFLCEAPGRSSLRTKLRASSMHNVEASIDAFGTVRCTMLGRVMMPIGTARCTSCNTRFIISPSPSGFVQHALQYHL